MPYAPAKAQRVQRQAQRGILMLSARWNSRRHIDVWAPRLLQRHQPLSVGTRPRKAATPPALQLDGGLLLERVDRHGIRRLAYLRFNWTLTGLAHISACVSAPSFQQSLAAW
eukprot:CAMPEP_0117489674 /NCGR_PEP_ID=MMETSP0784-20121206/17158_1 /TAXON_ID=39447 /ORGANISM="" /LENGTH=111 /DNA_ID=CAMNT_0005284411 /DNA_START=570 /DNA_END=902 /DNA_ORIENTATION=-